MPLINLIEEQRLSLKASRTKARNALIALSVVGVVSAFGCGLLWLESESLDTEVNKLRQDVEKVKPLLADIEDKKNTIAKVEPKLTTLENAHGISGKWNRVLNHLTVQTPPELWLTAIRTVATDATKPIEVSFIGVSSELNKVGEYILRLQSCPDMESVSLKFTQEKVISNGVGIEFEINSALAGTAEEVKKAEGETEEGK